MERRAPDASRDIAIVGMACRYPEANAPDELWKNVLAQRRAFRAVPSRRLRHEDYYSADRGAPDRTYCMQAAVLEGYEFDRLRFRATGTSFRSADMAHWLALDVADQALRDAGFPDADGLPRETTGVLLGNSLTGEFSRSGLMRYRWPYVRRVVEAALEKEGWDGAERRRFLQELETLYKRPFAPVGEESLAGGLSNTIAGRICNHFDLKGGGYTLDGACSSSLLAVANACASILDGDLDVALAGGVDLSLDPFEIVGFAKTGALAPEEMRVYDARSAGFWPGEGCGFLVLMRRDRAEGESRRIYALIKGWGISSDGSGGITRPEVEGQSLAIRRAYARAGLDIAAVPYFEGHGTGTAVGDATELRALNRSRGAAAAMAAVGSVKANIGHTKAAAGVAGLLKATLAVHHQILPANTACEDPNPELKKGDTSLRVLRDAEPWPADERLTAGVSSMGFGGINVHVALEGVAGLRRDGFSEDERKLLRSAQDAEVFFLSAPDAADLRRRIEDLLPVARRMARSELADLAAHLAGGDRLAPARAAVVASKPDELAESLQTIVDRLEGGETKDLDANRGIFLGIGLTSPRIAFLFPGQGAPSYCDGGALRRRFPPAQELYARARFPSEQDDVWTAVAQPAIVTASVAAWKILASLGVEARLALGHSLGELTAYHWGGALTDDGVLHLAAARGAAMGETGEPRGAMASLRATPDAVRGLIGENDVVIAGFNGPERIVVSGAAEAVARVVSRAGDRGVKAVPVRVSHAFHSPLVAPSAEKLSEHLGHLHFRPLTNTVVSTVTGHPLEAVADLRHILYRQVTEPVLFHQAMEAAIASGVDLFIEAGPGKILATLAAQYRAAPAISTDAGGPSLRGLLSAVGAAYALGMPVQAAALFEDRFTRPFDPSREPEFLVNPCELAPLPEDGAAWETAPLHEEPHEAAPPVVSSDDPLEVVRALVAARAELPLEAVDDDHGLLDDLHLNSIVVGQIVAEAARALALPPPVEPTEFATARVRDVAEALAELSAGDRPATRIDDVPAGVGPWIRTFSVRWIESPLSENALGKGGRVGGRWDVIAPEADPLAEDLRVRLAKEPGYGLIVCVPRQDRRRAASLLLAAADEALGMGEGVSFVLVQRGLTAGGFARTYHHEVKGATTCVVNVPADDPRAAEWVLAEIRNAGGYTEAAYDARGTRRTPVLEVTETQPAGGDPSLGPQDVLLVTGGGKGIAAECALELAKATGVKLALLGRSDPVADETLRSNLDRMRAQGVTVCYHSADVTNAAAVTRACEELTRELGPVTALLYGAGINEPHSLRNVDRDLFDRTVSTKCDGLENVLRNLDPAGMKLLVSFGSIIARIGLHGEADYALGNEWQTEICERFARDNPHCRCLNMEWSLWSGVGMGQRLGRVEALARMGVIPITPDEGIAWFLKLVGDRSFNGTYVVTSRFGNPPTLTMPKRELPHLRFLVGPRVHIPGVELVSDVDLSIGADPYLRDHQIRQTPVFPAVMGLEAMAQAAAALTGRRDVPRFENVEFLRPITVPSDGERKLRIAGLVRSRGRVEVVLRSDETSFQADHFRAVCAYDPPLEPARRIEGGFTDAAQDVGVNPEKDLYGSLLFQRGRFQRVSGYHRLTAWECEAVLSPANGEAWFSSYHPSECLLGDPGRRDAGIHSLQACIPHATILPVGVDRLVSHGSPEGVQRLRARERYRDGDVFIYDMEFVGPDERAVETWEGLKLRIAQPAASNGRWIAPLFVTYLERRLEELFHGLHVSVSVSDGLSGPRGLRASELMRRSAGPDVPIRRRPDGKPDTGTGISVSASHAGGLTLAVSAETPLACDVEPLMERPVEVWTQLMGADGYRLAAVIAREACEPAGRSATRVWTALECLKKAGRFIKSPLRLEKSLPDGWVLLASGRDVIATLPAQVGDEERTLVFGFIAQTP